ncbi:MAG: hypothetical protein NTW21_37640 [Verrucomicrobia bacterium]|nr:hypothetical protein [Verrucomicrobiota bacterium]
MKSAIPNSNPSRRWPRAIIRQACGLLTFLALLLCPPSVWAAARTASVSGNWSSTATWGGNPVPAAADTVTINQGVNVTVDTAAVCTSLTWTAIGLDTTLTISGANTLSVSGNITMPRPAAGFNLTMAIGAGTVTCGSLTMSATTPTTAARRDIITISTGTLNVSGVVTCGTTACEITFSDAGSLNLGFVGTVFTSKLTFTPATSTVTYNGAGNQIIGAFTYNNLVFSGSGVKSMATGTVVFGNQSIAPTGTATASVGAGLNLLVNSLTLGGTPQSSGTWGSTSSTATNKNDTYFAATTGYLTVGQVTITASADTGGSISPSGAVAVTLGTNQTFTLTPDSGNVVLDVLVDGVSVGAPTSYTFPTVIAGHTIVASFTASSAAIPQEAALLFGLKTDTLPASGNTGNWTAYAPAGGVFNTIGTPTVDNVGTSPVKWEKNVAYGMGFYNTWAWTEPVAVSGVSAVAAVKPVRISSNLRGWTPIIDVLFGAFRLGVLNNTGVVILTRSIPAGTQTQVSSTYTIPDGQTTILSAVVQSDGSYKVYANGLLIMSGGALTGGVTSLKSDNNVRRLVCIGTSQDDTSATLNGDIGDVYMWTLPLSTAERAVIENNLMAKFHAGPSYPSQTITASTTGGGGTLTPSGAVAVPYEADQTFTITKNYGYSADVAVDSVSQGDIATYTFNDVAAAHTIAVTYSAIPTRTISGHVSAAVDGGATISVKPAADSLPVQQTTTDGSGNYSMTVPTGAYYICASQTGYLISANTVCNATGDQTIDFALTQRLHLNGVARNIPKMENLLFASDANDLGAVGTSGNWPLLYSTFPGISQLTAIASPLVTKVRGLKYDNNSRVDFDGYLLNSAAQNTSIPVNGVTIVTLVKPVRNTTGDGWNNVVDVFYSNLRLIVFNNTGQVRVTRNNVDFTSVNDAAHTIPDGQITILTLVLDANGTFNCYASAWNNTTKVFGAPALMVSTATGSTFPALVPAQSGPEDFRKYISVGRNAPDGWTTFNGYIGDVFFYKTALSSTDQTTLQADLQTKMNSIATWNITATAGSNGTISPAGVTAVGDGDNQTYTITPAFGYDVSDVVVDGATQGGVTTYTFNAVNTTHTIDAAFVAKPTYAISGQVTDGTNPIAGAKVYVAMSANASYSPNYTLTTDASGNFSVNLINATWYVCSSATGFTTSSDTTVTVSGAAQSGINFALAASGKNIPQMDQLLFAAYGSNLTANGATTNAWPLEHPKGRTATIIGTPTLATVDGLQWEKNRYASGDGYTVGQYSAAMPINGLTATAVVQPEVASTNGNNWSSVIDVMYNRFILCVRGTDGMIRICRNGEWQNGPTIPNAQKTVLTAVVQADGKYQVFANGIKVMDITTTSAMAVLDPYWNAGGLGYWSYITVGRNSPDGWTTYAGNIGAAMLWKTALASGDRVAIETELGNTFGIVMPVYHNITVSTGAGGTISPAGNQSVVDGSNLTFTITPSLGYRILDVTVDSVSQGAVASLPLTNITAGHAVAVTFAVVPQYAVSGKVVDKMTSAAISGASVYFSPTPNAKTTPVYTATTDGSGNFTQVVYEGSYYVASDAANYYTSADSLVNVAADTSGVDLTLIPMTRNFPRTSDLLFSVVTDTLPSSGATGPWASYLPAGQNYTTIATPTAEVIDGVKWEKNLRSDSIAGANCGYTVGTYTSDIPVNGVTIVAAVKPAYNSPPIGGEFRGEIVDIFYSDLFLCVAHNDGQVWVCNRGYEDIPTGYYIPDGQKTILSVVVQPTGELALYANGVPKWTRSSGVDYTYLHPTGFTNINIGRNGPDGWSAFNGNIGDVLVYKVALSSSERKQLENDVAAKFGITMPVLHTITASAGANGTINPNGDRDVVEGQNQTFTISPTAGYAVADVLVDSVSQGALTSYTFYGVNAAHTIAATFVLTDLFVSWINTNYPGLSDKTPTGDPDGDRMSNQQEFAFGLDPSLGTSVNPITAQLDRATGKFSYTQRVGTGLAYSYEYSNTMADGDWHPFTPASTSSDSGTPVAVITVEVPGDLLLANPSLFVRVVAQ